MSDRNYLLIIDETPLNEDLKHYFAQFNIQIEHQKTLYPLQTEQEMPCAILIHWSLLTQAPHIINLFYNSFPVPLIIINDHADEEICITVLEGGADDFMIKPLYPRELHARISAISRRVDRSQKKAVHGKEILQFANWKLIPASRQLFDENHQELLLSAGEYDLLYTFLQHPQRVLDRELLLQINKNNDLNPLDRRIDVQISRLRQKIEVNAKKPILIKTIRNGGYLFTSSVVTLNEGEL